MADFDVTAPNGQTFRVTAPDGASQAEIMAFAQKQFGQQQELSAPRGSMGNIDPNREVGFADRLAASLKMTPDGKAGLLGFLGHDVITDRNGEQYVKDGKSYYPVNKKGFTVNDIADFGGDVAQALPTVIAGSNPWTVAGAGAAGNAARQGLSAILPGDDGMSLIDRAQSLAMDTALAGAGQAGLNKVLGGTFSGAAKTASAPSGFVGPLPIEPGGMDALRPGNVFRGVMQRAEERGAAAAGEGDALTKATGIEWTPGQRTQSKGLLTMEGMLRRNPFSADRWTDFDQQQLGKATQYLASTLDSINPGQVGPAVAGGSVKRAFDRVLDGALRARSAQGRADFEAVDQISQGAPLFGTMNTVKAIDDIIGKFDTPGGGDASAALVSKLKSLRAEFLPPAPPVGGNQVSQGLQGTPMALTGRQMQRLLQIYGDAARGTGQVFSDIDKAQQRTIAREVMGGLWGDVEAAGQISGIPQASADALKAARENWKANSQVINGIEENVLGRIFGGHFDKAPERVAEQFRNMRPTEIKGAFELLDKGSPDAAQQVKRYLIEDAMRKAGVPDQASGAPQLKKLGNDAFSPAKFLSSIKESPVWATLDGNEKFQMTTVFRSMERLAERAGTDGSPTAPLMQAWGAVKSMFSMNPVTMAGGAVGMLAPGKMSEALLTTEGRRALVQVSTTSPTSKSFTAGLAYLAALSGTDAPQTATPTPNSRR